MKPVIIGVSGTKLDADERMNIAALDPAGFILFKHNVQDRDQLRGLTDDLRSISGRSDVPILIDQEGGRVSRLPAPIWPQFPSAEQFSRLYAVSPIAAIEAARVNAQAISSTLSDLGINVNCMPVLDICHGEDGNAITDRALGQCPMQVAALGRAVIDGLANGGVAAVIKHLPGQGRAKVDSHAALPIIDADVDALANDIAPFAALSSHAKIAMTGHVVYTAWDHDQPATFSAAIIRDIIRNQIGFDGLLLSDDLHMDALTGSIANRAIAALAAGCDVALACWVRESDLAELGASLPNISDAATARMDAAIGGTLQDIKPTDVAHLLAKRDALLGSAA
jgi:beta-N-acetylhexosaminidase